MSMEELNTLAERIRRADLLFKHGEFERSYQAARQLLVEIETVPTPPGAQWHGELLGLIGRCALKLYRSQEALDATREALCTIRELRDDTLSPLVEGLRENLLTALAALEPPASGASPLTHRMLRAQIVRAQILTDRHRFARSVELLESIRARLHELGGGDFLGSEEASEPSDARLLYLPKILGLLGFNLFHQGELERSRLLTEQAIAACRSLSDRTGQRVYQTSLAWIDQQTADDTE